MNWNVEPGSEQRFKFATLYGLLASGAVWLLILIKSSGGWTTSAQGYLYNIPISVVFTIACIDLLLATVFPLPFRMQDRLHLLPYFVVWALGFVQLYLRLVDKSIDISGHMTWLTILITHSILKGLPRWFILFGLVVWLEAAFLNFHHFSFSKSSIKGVIAGLMLSTLIVNSHIIRPKSCHNFAYCFSD